MVSSRTSAARMIASVSIIIAASTACSASSEYGGCRSANGSRSVCSAGIEELAGLLDIFPRWALPAGIPEKRGWMVGDDHRDTIIAMDRAPELADRQFRLQQRLRGERAERQDHFGTKQLDLTDEKRAAGRDFVWQRVPVTRGPVFQDVHDERV